MKIYRPEKLEDIIGQSKVKEVCKIAVSAARKENRPIPHMLFDSGAGTGKTTFAKVLGYEREVNTHIINSADVSINDIQKYLFSLEENDILFFDEIHRLSTKSCEFLYTVMEDFYCTKGNYQYNIKPFTLIGATTHSGMLPRPLVSRFKIHVLFQDYNLAELTDIVDNVARLHDFELTHKIAEVIARTCRLNPRNAVTRAEFVRDYMLTYDVESLSIKELLDIIELQGVDAFGLTLRDRQYLELLDKNSVLSLKALANKLNTDVKTIEFDIEPYLIKLNLISISRVGREINYPVYKFYLEKLEKYKNET